MVNYKQKDLIISNKQKKTTIADRTLSAIEDLRSMKYFACNDNEICYFVFVVFICVFKSIIAGNNTIINKMFKFLKSKYFVAKNVAV